MADDLACLNICVTCRAGAPAADPLGDPAADVPAGRHLFNAVAALPAPRGVAVRGFACLANCDQGCSAALTMPGKWQVLLGRLTPALAADLLTYAGAYAASATGTLMPSARPPSLRNVVLGRIPGPGMTQAGMLHAAAAVAPGAIATRPA